MSKILPRWSAESNDRLLATDGLILIARGTEEDDEDEDDDEDDGYSE